MEFLTITGDDLPLIRSLNSDPRMMVHLGGPQPEEQILRSHASILKAIEQGGWCFKIVPQPGEPAAGTILIWETTWEGEPVHEMGWMVLPEFQGRGIASEAVRTVLERAREQQAFEAVHAFPGIGNAASNRICEKNGFSNLGVCDIDYTGRMLKCNHWRIELE